MTHITQEQALALAEAIGMRTVTVPQKLNAEILCNAAITWDRAQRGEPVAIVRAKEDIYGGPFVHWTSLPVPGMKLYAHPPQPVNTQMVEALKWLDKWMGHKPLLECANKVRAALAAAKEQSNG